MANLMAVMDFERKVMEVGYLFVALDKKDSLFIQLDECTVQCNSAPSCFSGILIQSSLAAATYHTFVAHRVA